MQPPSPFTRIFDELKRRRVFRVATLYVIFLWPIIQIVDILSPALDLPESTMRVLLILFVGGFPVALVLGWLFNLNSSGIILTTDESEPAPEHPLIGKNTERLIIGVLLIVVFVLFGIQLSTNEQNQQTAGDLLTSAAPATETSTRANSIAVLPFISFSQADQDRYFADGLTEELLNVLSRLNGLRVAARTSSFAYRDVSKTVQQIGKELNVDTILEGSVRRNDINDTVRVTAQLIDVATGSHLWSQTYDRQLQDIFKVQDEIASSVVSHLEFTLLGNETLAIKSRASANAQAMVAYSMGQTELARRSRIGFEDAIRYFQKAIESDPNYAEAYSGLADANTLLFIYVKMNQTDLLQNAQQAVDKALALDPLMGKAWASQGLIYMQDPQKHTEAIKALEKAMELSPNYAMAYMWYGSLMEDQDVQADYHRKAFELDPRSPVAAYNVANDLILAGREAEAMEIFNLIIEVDPYYAGAYRLVAQINKFRGRLDESIVQYKKVYSLEASAETAMEIAALYLDLGDFENSLHWSSLAEPDLRAEDRVGFDWYKISVAVAKGDDEKADELLRAQLLTGDKLSANSQFGAIYAAYLLKDYPRVVELYEAATINPQDTNKIGSMFVDATIGAAYAYKQLNRLEQSNQLLASVGERIEKTISSKRRFEPSTWYQKAELLAIQDKPQLAIVYLQRAVDEGWRQPWRPAVDPALTAILPDENFQSMMSGLTARMNLMRDQLAFESSDDAWQG